MAPVIRPTTDRIFREWASAWPTEGERADGRGYWLFRTNRSRSFGCWGDSTHSRVWNTAVRWLNRRYRGTDIAWDDLAVGQLPDLTDGGCTISVRWRWRYA